jgi:hypothetical protein
MAAGKADETVNNFITSCTCTKEKKTSHLIYITATAVK